MLYLLIIRYQKLLGGLNYRPEVISGVPFITPDLAGWSGLSYKVRIRSSERISGRTSGIRQGLG